MAQDMLVVHNVVGSKFIDWKKDRWECKQYFIIKIKKIDN